MSLRLPHERAASLAEHYFAVMVLIANAASTDGFVICRTAGCLGIQGDKYARKLHLCDACAAVRKQSIAEKRAAAADRKALETMARRTRGPRIHADLRRVALGLPPQTRRYAGPPRRGFVYRLWDIEGRLLYVGKTYRVAARLYGPRGHARTREWWAEVRSISVATYATETEALAAEAAAIASENPRYNVARPAPPDHVPVPLAYVLGAAE